MNKILLPVDGSDHSRRAIAKAAELSAVADLSTFRPIPKWPAGVGGSHPIFTRRWHTRPANKFVRIPHEVAAPTGRTGRSRPDQPGLRRDRDAQAQTLSPGEAMRQRGWPIRDTCRHPAGR